MRKFYTKYPFSLILKAFLEFIVVLIIANLGQGNIGFTTALLYIFILAPTSFLLIDLLVLPSLGVRAANLADWLWFFIISIFYRNLGYLDVGIFQLLFLVSSLIVVEHFFHKMLLDAIQN